MEQQIVMLEDFAREVEAMLQTCFEGEVVRCGTAFTLLLPSGQRFIVQLSEAA